MLTWTPGSVDRAAHSDPSAATGLLYRFAVAFPTWAGAILAVYAILSYRGPVPRFRLK